MAVNPTWHLPVTQVVAEHYGLEVAQVLGSSRQQRIALARHVCWYIHQLDQRTLSDIGRAYGVDHSTVSHGKARIAALSLADKPFSRELAALMLSLNEGKPVQPVYEITIPPGSIVNIHRDAG
jgi:hypothetical protein